MILPQLRTATSLKRDVDLEVCPLQAHSCTAVCREVVNGDS